MRFVMWKKGDNQIVYVDILRRRCVKITKYNDRTKSIVINDKPMKYIRIDGSTVLVQLADGEQILYGFDEMYILEDLYTSSNPLYWTVKTALDFIKQVEEVLQ